MVNAQNWLNNKYPNKQETKEIKANDSEQLHGSLIITDYPNLEIIHIPDQKNLTQLQIINNEKLEILDVTNNYRLTNLSHNLNLEELIIRNNNFAEQDLNFLKNLVNLKRLELGNDNQEKIQQGIYNRFVSSLKPLQNLSRLERFDIRNTDLDSGLEYLPKSIKVFKYSADKRKEAKCRIIEEQLASHKNRLES
ncbi:9072_t:CDS:2 [Entrophospora sp. SA101]|nr:9072_t:CDS:2 [Entrophospora sp. SA101]